MKATLEEVGDRSARTHPPLKNKIQKTRGRETHAREVKAPSPSMANHVLDLFFKPLNP